ncbi:MAG: N-acetylmuramoyl-L-alanine amidase [Candidatus Dormiibacterota bacterium]
MVEIRFAAYTVAVAMRKGPTHSPYVLALALGIAALGGGLVTGTVMASPHVPTPVAQHLKPPRRYVVAIMPGHGGYDPGAISPFNGLKEKNVTLSMGLDLRHDLEADGVKVVMTRTTDTFVSVSKSESDAVKEHADVLISLWVNDWTDASLEGATVFMPYSKDMTFAQPLNTEMAAAIAPAGMGDRGVQMLPQLWVHAPMPAVTIEVGFMSNPQDSQLLAEPNFRAAVAGGIARGMLTYAPQITRIDTELVAYRRAEAQVVAAQKVVAAQQASLRQMSNWEPLLLLLDAVLLLALYNRAVWRQLRRRMPASAGTLRTPALLLARGGGAFLDALWHSLVRLSPRPSRRGWAEPPSRRSQNRTRPRRAPREWRGRAAGVHPRRVTEMVQPGDRHQRGRRSIYDDFSF